ncbi:MAG: hypothetical protein K0Q87_4341 [Neobacillus sp.]|nr:hypothetical protein [Neobacillus sp.]
MPPTIKQIQRQLQQYTPIGIMSIVYIIFQANKGGQSQILWLKKHDSNIPKSCSVSYFFLIQNLMSLSSCSVFSIVCPAFFDQAGRSFKAPRSVT